MTGSRILADSRRGMEVLYNWGSRGKVGESPHSRNLCPKESSSKLMQVGQWLASEVRKDCTLLLIIQSSAGGIPQRQDPLSHNTKESITRIAAIRILVHGLVGGNALSIKNTQFLAIVIRYYVRRSVSLGTAPTFVEGQVG